MLVNDISQSQLQDISPKNNTAGNLPNFIIGGAPKCGTTSLHFILDQHPNIKLPKDEVNFLDADDPLNWPDFFYIRNSALRWRDPSGRDAQAMAWYKSQFVLGGAPAVIGEDSTRYLFSPVVAHRICDMMPQTRVIFMLRDPVKRAYSQYWHDIKMMRETRSFEGAIRKNASIVGCSTYAPHLRHWIDVLGRDRVHVVLFEDFIKDRQGTLDSVLDFINAPRLEVPVQHNWFNKTYYPVSLTAQRAMNFFGRHIARQRYRTHIAPETTTTDWWVNKLYQKWFHNVSPLLLRSTDKPQMKPSTEAYLTAHLKDRNQGLDTLLDRDLSHVWPSWNTSL